MTFLPLLHTMEYLRKLLFLILVVSGSRSDAFDGKGSNRELLNEDLLLTHRQSRHEYDRDQYGPDSEIERLRQILDAREHNQEPHSSQGSQDEPSPYNLEKLLKKVQHKLHQGSQERQRDDSRERHHGNGGDSGERHHGNGHHGNGVDPDDDRSGYHRYIQTGREGELLHGEDSGQDHHQGDPPPPPPRYRNHHTDAGRHGSDDEHEVHHSIEKEHHGAGGDHHVEEHQDHQGGHHGDHGDRDHHGGGGGEHHHRDHEHGHGHDRDHAHPHPTPAYAKVGDHSGYNPGGRVASMSDVYFLAVVAGCSIAGVIGLIVAGVCWYRLQKNVKEASEAQYPAYGVTGPTKERAGSPGDRKLAHSAQMYHYQHQKQQMLAMEKANGDMTKDDEEDSEEENEEGDYTVYECPGLAPTGEMEVKNPLFSEETPVTPSAGGDPRSDMK